MNRKEYFEILTKTRGKDFVEKNKDLLDAEFEYLETLGDPEDEIGEIEDVVISG